MDFSRILFWMKYIDVMGVCCVVGSERKKLLREYPIHLFVINYPSMVTSMSWAQCTHTDKLIHCSTHYKTIEYIT